jgi:predicted RNA binding protein YcfA (HicA-like mRNA interferase family)
VSGKKLVRLLVRNGWSLIRINGSHHILAKGTLVASVPVHGNRDVGKGLEIKILKAAGLRS